MKLNFALSLSFEGISLLGRVPGGWTVLSEVPLDAEDLHGALKNLREVADARGANQGQVKLIIPNEQIRYLTLPKPESDLDATIRRSLDGATPYAVADLVYDSMVTGSTVMVAAVARETLDEAESFARDYSFDPVSFVARAPAGQFGGEVFFGAVPGWAGPAPTRDSGAISIVTVPEAEAETLAARGSPVPEVHKPAQAREEMAEPVRAYEPLWDPEAPSAEPVSGNSSLAARPATPHPRAPITPPGPIEPETEPLIAADPEGGEEADRRALEDMPAPNAASFEAVSTPTVQKAFADHRAEDSVRSREAPLASGKADDEDAPRAPARGTASARPDDALAPGQAEDAQATPRLQVPQPEAGQAVGVSGRLAPSRDSVATNPPFSDLRARRDTPQNAEQAPPIDPKPVGHARNDTAPRITPRPVEPRTGPVVSERNDARPAFAEVRSEPVSHPGRPTTPRVATPVPDAATAAPIASLSRPASLRSDLPAGDAGKATPGNLVKGFFSRRSAGRVQPAPPLQRQDRTPPLHRQGKTPLPADRDETPVSAPATLGTAPVSAPPAMFTSAKASPQQPGVARLAAVTPDSRVETPAPQAKFAAVDAAPVEPATAADGGAAVMSAQESERQRMTVFGAREKEARVGGKPRFLGLMLTAALLLFLIGVAAWASVYYDEGIARFFRPDSNSTEIAEAPETDVPPEILQQESAVDPELALEPEESDVAALSTDIPPETVPETPSEPQPAPSLTQSEADATYAETGIWQRAPAAPLEPEQTQIEDLYVASIDPDVQQFDAVALPPAQTERQDVIYESPRPPLPADVTFDLTERGFVRATPEGAINPDGILIYAGLPPAVPPQRDGGGTLDLTDSLPPTPEASAAVEAEQDRLQEFRPRTRPGGLIERNERATLSGASVAELAAFRPNLRPETAKVEEEADITATERAIAQSAKPLPRPRDIERIVEAARAAPPAAEEALEEEPVQVAAVAPRTVAPSIPSTASVAQQATVRNALNLREVNLIGVYGKPASRRALVRLTNGRYQKVKVGDSIDGGRVAAIGETELRYTKGGRNVTLTMPQG